MQETTEIYDFCIIGSGAGGAVSAYELSKENFKVVLVESGNGQIKSVSSNILKYATDNFYYSSMQPIFSNSTITTIVNRKIGGTTEINSAILKNAPDFVLKKWSTLFSNSEKFINDMNQAYQEIDQEIKPEVSNSIRMGLNNSIVDYGLSKLKWESSPLPRAVENCEKTGNCLTSCPNNRKKTMSRTYLKWAKDNGLKIIENVEVYAFQKRNSYFEIFDKEKQTIIKAKKIILASGIFGSPLILKNSKIKNREIGKNLQLHLGVAVMGKFHFPIDIWNSSTQGWSSSQFIERGMVMESLAMHPGLVATRIPSAGEEFQKELNDIRKYSILTIKASSNTRGRVLFFKNKVFPFFYLSKKDISDIKFGIEKCSEVLFKAGAEKINLGIKGYSPFINVHQLEHFKNHNIKAKDLTLICNHIFGTCSLGKVVNEHGKLIGYDDVYIVDTSIIPTTMANNPQKTIMALSKIITKNIIREIHEKN